MLSCLGMAFLLPLGAPVSTTIQISKCELDTMNCPQVWVLYVSDRKMRNGIWVMTQLIYHSAMESMVVNEKVRLDTYAYVYSAYTTVLSMKTGYISPLFTRERRCAFNVNQSQRAVQWLCSAPQRFYIWLTLRADLNSYIVNMGLRSATTRKTGKTKL